MQSATKLAAQQRLEKLLKKVFDSQCRRIDKRNYSYKQRDFIFHMTDWIEDAQWWAKITKNPPPFSTKVEYKIVSFLLHTIPHLNVAGFMLLGDLVKGPKDWAAFYQGKLPYSAIGSKRFKKKRRKR